MRLSVLPLFTSSEVDLAGLLQFFRERDVDVIAPEGAISSLSSVRTEAQRIGRADCDGVAFLLENVVNGPQVTMAALHVACPIVLVGVEPTLFDAAMGLMAAGLPFDRIVARPETAGDLLFSWLMANRKTERQPGIEAAHKLYGQILAVPVAPTVPIDTAQWAQQLGIVVTSESDSDADFVASDGDAYAALTQRLLFLIGGIEPTVVTVGEEFLPDTTYLQIGRQSGRFVASVMANVTQGDTGSPRPLDVSPKENLPVSRWLSRRLYGIPGNKMVAIKAALYTLDITLI